MEPLVACCCFSKHDRHTIAFHACFKFISALYPQLTLLYVVMNLL